MIEIGTDNVEEIHIDDDPICEVWQGEELLWEWIVSDEIPIANSRPTGSGFLWRPGSHGAVAQLVDDVLTDQTAYLVWFSLSFAFGSSRGGTRAGAWNIRFTTDSTDTSGSGAGPDLIAAWENYERAIELRAGDHSLILPGPNHPDNALQDATDPYSARYPADQDGGLADNDRIAAFITAYNDMTQAERNGLTITLRAKLCLDDVDPVTEAPGPVRNLTASIIEQTRFRASWDEPNTGGRVQGYRLEYRQGTSGTWIEESTPGILFDFIDGLTAGTTYQYRVRAENAAGNSAWVTGSVTTLAAGVTAPGPVRSLTAAGAIYSPSTRMFIDWRGPGTGGSVTSYEIEWGRTIDYSDGSATSNVTDYTVTGLNPSCTYYFRVRAVGPGGRSAWQSVSRATTGLQVPGPVRNLTARGEQTGGVVLPSIVIDWDAPNIGGVAGTYDVEWGPSNNPPGNSATTGNTRYTALAGVVSQQRHTVRVRGRNRSGAGAWATVSDILTP